MDITHTGILKERHATPGVRKTRRLKAKAKLYVIIEGVWHRKSFLGSWQRCVEPLQENYVIREIHEGSCSLHARPRSVVAKAIQLGYYGPIMHSNARVVCKKCDKFQIHKPVPRLPQRKLTPITLPWSFHK